MDQVFTKDDKKYDVTYLRAKNVGKMIFIFPAKEDLAWVKEKHIKRKVETAFMDTT